MKRESDLNDEERHLNTLYMDVHSSIKMSQGRYKNIRLKQKSIDLIKTIATNPMMEVTVFDKNQEPTQLWNAKIEVDNEMKSQYELF